MSFLQTKKARKTACFTKNHTYWISHFMVDDGEVELLNSQASLASFFFPLKTEVDCITSDPIVVEHSQV